MRIVTNGFHDLKSDRQPIEDNLRPGMPTTSTDDSKSLENDRTGYVQSVLQQLRVKIRKKRPEL